MSNKNYTGPILESDEPIYNYTSQITIDEVKNFLAINTKLVWNILGYIDIKNNVVQRNWIRASIVHHQYEMIIDFYSLERGQERFKYTITPKNGFQTRIEVRNTDTPIDATLIPRLIKFVSGRI